MLDVLSSGKGVHLGLVVEGEGGRLGLVLVVILPVTTHPLQCRICYFIIMLKYSKSKMLNKPYIHYIDVK